jgi:hypothetical protein
MSKRRLSNFEKWTLGLTGMIIVLGLLTWLSSFFIPEVRVWLHLEKPVASPPAVSKSGQASPAIQSSQPTVEPKPTPTPRVVRHSEVHVKGSGNVAGNSIAGNGNIVGNNNQVTAPAPAAVAPNGIAIAGGTVTNPTVNNFGPPPLKLTWSVVPGEATAKFPYRQNVTVKTNVDFHPVSVAVICDGEINQIQAYGAMFFPHFGITKESNKIGYIYYENPPLAPGVSLEISVDSMKPFSVVDVRQANINF